jgi:hypothetical protein
MEGSLMDEFVVSVKKKLEEYGYNIYNVAYTSTKNEHCIMTDGMMIFANGDENSITISFKCNLEPETVAHNMMVLNEILETRIVYISESYYLDKKNKKYVMGEEAKKLAIKEITDLALREMAKDQIYSHILATQKCHEC